MFNSDSPLSYLLLYKELALNSKKKHSLFIYEQAVPKILLFNNFVC